jgi:hypothetical protein
MPESRSKFSCNSTTVPASTRLGKREETEHEFPHKLDIGIRGRERAAPKIVTVSFRTIRRKFFRQPTSTRSKSSAEALGILTG